MSVDDESTRRFSMEPVNRLNRGHLQMILLSVTGFSVPKYTGSFKAACSNTSIAILI